MRDPPEKNPPSRGHSQHGHNHRSEHSGRSGAHTSHYDRRDSRDHAFYSPVGGGSVETGESSPYSENSGVDDGGGYGATYAEAHRHEERRRNRDHYSDRHSHRRLEPAVREDGGGSATPSDGEDGRRGPASREEEYGKHSARAAPSSAQASRRSKQSKRERTGSRNQLGHSGRHGNNGSAQKHRPSSSSRRLRSLSEGHSLSRSLSGSDSDSSGSACDSAQEPIIELLERERRSALTVLLSILCIQLPTVSTSTPCCAPCCSCGPPAVLCVLHPLAGSGARRGSS